VKIHREYVLNATSKNILWTAISTPVGLEGWFAHSVKVNDKIVTFKWGKNEERQAELLSVRIYSHVRFHWLDDENEHEYFELRMINDELTNDYILEVIDFADATEAEDMYELWDAQVETLRRTCGF
jgi:uncharacterized protein YndB with AHSA1/START domain